MRRATASSASCASSSGTSPSGTPASISRSPRRCRSSPGVCCCSAITPIHGTRAARRSVPRTLRPARSRGYTIMSCSCGSGSSSSRSNSASASGAMSASRASANRPISQSISLVAAMAGAKSGAPPAAFDVVGHEISALITRPASLDGTSRRRQPSRARAGHIVPQATTEKPGIAWLPSRTARTSWPRRRTCTLEAMRPPAPHPAVRLGDEPRRHRAAHAAAAEEGAAAAAGRHRAARHRPALAYPDRRDRPARHPDGRGRRAGDHRHPGGARAEAPRPAARQQQGALQGGLRGRHRAHRPRVLPCRAEVRRAAAARGQHALRQRAHREPTTTRSRWRTPTTSWRRRRAPICRCWSRSTRSPPGCPARCCSRPRRQALERVPELPEWQDAAWLKERGWPDIGTALTRLHRPQEAARRLGRLAALAAAGLRRAARGPAGAGAGAAELQAAGRARACVGDGRVRARIADALPVRAHQLAAPGA